MAMAVDEDVVLAIAGEQQLVNIGAEMQFHDETLADSARGVSSRMAVQTPQSPVLFAGAGRLR
ncbi:MAG: hypothetical protein J0J02_01900 [Thiobacillus sp.]|nr:hypothetical protein [Thiobacillus sp.]